MGGATLQPPPCESRCLRRVRIGLQRQRVPSARRSGRRRRLALPRHQRQSRRDARGDRASPSHSRSHGEASCSINQCLKILKPCEHVFEMKSSNIASTCFQHWYLIPPTESCLQPEPQRARQVPATRRRHSSGRRGSPRRRLPPLRSRCRSRRSRGPPHGVGKLPAWIPGIDHESRSITAPNSNVISSLR